MKNKYFNKEKPMEFSFKEMGIAQAQKVLAGAMTGTPEQLQNQAEFIKWTGIELLTSMAFNENFDGKTVDRQGVFDWVKDIQDIITDRALSIDTTKLEFVPASKN